MFFAQGFKLSDAAVRVLETKPFANLTGCPAECTYSASWAVLGGKERAWAA